MGGARSLFLCDPYPGQKSQQRGRHRERSENEEIRKSPFGSAKPLKLSDVRIEPYRCMLNLNTVLGTDKPRDGHSRLGHCTGKSRPANARPASPPRRLTEQEKLRSEA